MTIRTSPLLWAVLMVFVVTNLQAQEGRRAADKFKQLYEELPTPDAYHNAAGAPGHAYWQQQADYVIKLEIDDEKQRINGDESITYHNNSPDQLEYLWLQLDQNVRALDSDKFNTATMSINDEMSMRSLGPLFNEFDGGFKIDGVTTKKGEKLSFTINKTMMRVDLPTPLKPGDSYTFNVKYWYNVNDGATYGGRSGYEYFPEDDNYMYSIAQFYPRMAQYNEVDGWQNKQFLGRGEFCLSFGDYEVHITVPEDHIVGATGVLQNPKDVLTQEQRDRLEVAKTAEKPHLIITQDEAEENEKKRGEGKKTWIFKAENVRDFGFVSSRKLIWDAQGVPFDDRVVMAMSYYPKEGNPLWEQYSTNAVVHTLKTYSKYTFPYPYPTAISTHASFTGMEYPMICFNFGRPRADGTYSERIKYAMISVIIHEVGHNYFPMIVNSDERQWTWMDEGLNSFLQYLTECEWDRDYPSRRGPAYKITDYMKGDKDNIVPIMTNSESIRQFGNNAYGKPATALNILRESILGRELFDYAFKVYANRWKFKHPTPADFFRTMEDASGVDLDWFWRGWFYSTDHVDISLESVEWYRLNTYDANAELMIKQEWDAQAPQYITDIRNQEEIKETELEKRPDELADVYNKQDPNKPTERQMKTAEYYKGNLSEAELELVEAGYNYYEMTFSNVGGLIMPIILNVTYDDGTSEVVRIPAEIWRYNVDEVSKVFVTEKQITEVVLDPFLETADTDRDNNYFPSRHEPTRFEIYMRNR